jgi:hypothetical protein
MTTSIKNTTKTKSTNDSTKALWIGIIFSFAFTALIWATGPYLPQIEFLPDSGPLWYYWQLPEATFWTRASAWGLYLAHQIAIWGFIFYAQRNKLKYTGGLHKLNIAMLVTNAVFITLHLVQSHIWYDALAQDTSILSSQGSVILLLVMVLLMENQRRGLFFGKKVKGLKEPAQFVRKYHGYIFAWATIFTFWYHPMETTGGHLIGFLYTFFLMLQGSLIFTRAHVNKYWMVVNEVAVLFHGTLVAILAGQEVWPMFLFGFATLFVVTQMYGLGWKPWMRWTFITGYIVAVLAVYSVRGWENLNEILRIPVIEYGLVFVLALIIWLGLRLYAGASRLFSRGKGLATATD